MSEVARKGIGGAANRIESAFFIINRIWNGSMFGAAVELSGSGCL
jgi:hypothetical protein